MKPDDKWRCESCGMIVFSSELLCAASPFDGGDILHGCPNCKTVNDFRRACDHAGCTNYHTAGTPHPTGYKMHCHLHPPSKDAV